MLKRLVALLLLLVWLASPLPAEAMKKNVGSQHVGTILVDTSGNAVTGGTTTVYVICDGVQSTGAGTIVHTGNGDWDYTPTQTETNCNDVRYLFANSSAVAAEVEFNPTPFDSNGYPISTIFYIDSHRAIWNGSAWQPQ